MNSCQEIEEKVGDWEVGVCFVLFWSDRKNLEFDSGDGRSALGMF